MCGINDCVAETVGTWEVPGARRTALRRMGAGTLFSGLPAVILTVAVVKTKMLL